MSGILFKINLENLIFCLPAGGFYLIYKYKETLKEFQNKNFQEIFKKLDYNNKNEITKNKDYLNYEIFMVKYNQDNHFESMIKYLTYKRYLESVEQDYQYILPALFGLNLITTRFGLLFSGIYFFNSRFNFNYMKKKLEYNQINKINKTYEFKKKINGLFLVGINIIFIAILFKKYNYFKYNSSIIKKDNFIK